MSESVSAEQRILLDRAKSDKSKYQWVTTDGKVFTASVDDHDKVRTQVLKHMKKLAK